jgi:hypothetical protein
MAKAYQLSPWAPALLAQVQSSADADQIPACCGEIPGGEILFGAVEPREDDEVELIIEIPVR